jgi:hypothetical protein
MDNEATRAGAPEAQQPSDVGRSLRLDVGRDGHPRGPGNLAVTRYLESGETPNNCIVRADPRFPERTGKRV